MAVVTTKQAQAVTDRVQFSVRLPKQLHKKVEHFTTEHELSLQDVCEQALGAYIAPDRDKAISRARNPLAHVDGEDKAALLSLLELFHAGGAEARGAAKLVRSIANNWRKVTA